MKQLMKFLFIFFVVLVDFKSVIAFPLTSPWVAGEDWISGDGTNGSYYNTNAHTGRSYYCLDFNRHLKNDDLRVPIVAIKTGIVKQAHVWTGNRDKDPLGNYVRITHADSEVLIAHLDNLNPVVSPGELVTAGQVLGFTGTTGNSTGSHLHFCIYQNGKTVPLSPMDGIIMETPEDSKKRIIISRNTNLFDQAFARFGSGKMGQKEYEMWDVEKAKSVGSAYHPWLLQWNPNDLYASNGIPRNCYIQHCNGGEFGDSAIVYDGLGGGRQAYVIRSGFWAYWTNAGGPRSALGMPITEEYFLANGDVRQDFQLGYLQYHKGGNPEVTKRAYPKTTPGWTDKGWDPKVSYRIANAYNNRGRAKILGEATDIVRKATLTNGSTAQPNILKQKFQYGTVFVFDRDPTKVQMKSVDFSAQGVGEVSEEMDPEIFTDETNWCWESLDLSSQARVYYAPTSGGTSTVAYAHPATGDMHVVFAGVDGRVYEFTSSDNGASWSAIDVSALVPVPYAAAESSVFGYADAVNEDRYVVFEGMDHRVYEIRYNAVSGTWSVTDLSAQGPVDYADNASDPSAVVDAEGNRSVVFSGNNAHVYEFTYHHEFDVWTAADLSVLAAVPYIAPGTSPIMYQDPSSGERFITFTGENARIQLITIAPEETENEEVAPTTAVTEYAPGRVTSLDLSSQTPVGWADTSSEPAGCIDPLTSDHWVIFNSVDQRVTAFRKRGEESIWTSIDVSGQAPAPLMAAGTHPTCFTDNFSGTFVIGFTGTDGHIWQMAYDGMSWTSVDMSGEAPVDYAASGTSPVGFVNPINGEYFFSFIGSNARIQSLSYVYQP